MSQDSENSNEAGQERGSLVFFYPSSVGATATSGSVKWLRSTNFMGSLLSISKNFDIS
jgi:hypothetical protein